MKTGSTSTSGATDALAEMAVYAFSLVSTVVVIGVDLFAKAIDQGTKPLVGGVETVADAVVDGGE